MARPWEHLQDSYRAATVRVALAVFNCVALPVLAPGMWRHFPVLALYLVSALFFQLLIKRGIGGVWRVLGGCMVDVAMLTFVVHQLGSVSTVLVGAYLLTSMFTALVAPPWVARSLGALGIVAYGAVLYAEAIGVLPYAPAVGGFEGWRPDVSVAWRSVALLLTLVVVCTLVSERITKALHEREDQLKEANSRLEELSQRDPLTQLYNRREFVRRLEQELERVRRGHALALLMIDLDGFKHINDFQGHLAGDDLLRRVAQAIVTCTRAVDVSGRFGGDEFVVALTETEEHQAVVVAKRLVDTIRGIGAEFDPERPVTASVGIAIARPQDDVIILVNTADESAYRAKSAGGDGFCLQDPERNSAQFESGPRNARAG